MKTSVIEDKRIIEKIKEEYRRRGWIRDLILFTLSINTGAKLVNLLELKISDVKNKDVLRFKDVANITRVFPLNAEIKTMLQEYCNLRSDKEFLFSSKKNPAKAITRIEVFRKFKTVCDSIGVYDNYSVASWRKTFGYHYYLYCKYLYQVQPKQECIRFQILQELMLYMYLQVQLSRPRHQNHML